MTYIFNLQEDRLTFSNAVHVTADTTDVAAGVEWGVLVDGDGHGAINIDLDADLQGCDGHVHGVLHGALPVDHAWQGGQISMLMII